VRCSLEGRVQRVQGVLGREFLRGLRERGLDGVQLVRRGPMAPVDQVVAGATWQRWVHFKRNVLTRVPKGSSAMFATTIRTVFVQPTSTLIREQVEVVPARAGPPGVAAMLREVREESTRSPTAPQRTGPRSGQPTPRSAQP
jgi:putative transposase